MNADDYRVRTPGSERPASTNTRDDRVKNPGLPAGWQAEAYLTEISRNDRGASRIGYSKFVNGIAEALASVSESEQELVAMLYGFDGQRRTPEEVARLCQRSLTQVDQTAKKVLRRMRHPACTKLIREALACADESIWTALAGKHGIVSSPMPARACRASSGSVSNPNSASSKTGCRRTHAPLPRVGIARGSRSPKSTG